MHTPTGLRSDRWVCLLYSAEGTRNGEREVIALAVELNADAVLMDDRDGTQDARRNDFTIFGTFALLDKAAERELLALPEAIARLTQTTFASLLLQ